MTAAVAPDFGAPRQKIDRHATFDDRVCTTSNDCGSPLMHQITMNLQAFRCVAVNLKPLPYQRGMELCKGRSASPYTTPLPERRREYAQRQHPYATTIQTK